MSFAQQLANRVVASMDTWLQAQVSKFEQACVARSDQGHSGVRHETDPVLSGFDHSLVTEKMRKVVEGFGFSSADVQIAGRWCTSIGAPKDVLVVTADWGSLCHAAGSEQKGPPQGGHIQICALCQEERPVVVLSPCGHVICLTCEQKRSNRPQCPFCRQHVNSVTHGLLN